MDMMDMALFKGIKGKMDWLGQRQAVLSKNIANADTPGYIPYDVKPLAFDDFVAAVEQTRTNPVHMVGMPAQSGGKTDEAETTYETAPSGNAVVLEEQVMKAAETGMDYQMMANLYTKTVSMLRIAIGRGGGG